jgi:hypothetical protein
VLSVMGGYIESVANFNSANTLNAAVASNTSLTFTGGTVAGSLTYMHTGFFIDALVKADFLS